MVDEELILKVKAKDKSAFRRLYELYKEKVYFTAYSILKDKHLSDCIYHGMHQRNNKIQASSWKKVIKKKVS